MQISSKTASEIDEFQEKKNLKTLEAIFFVSGRFLDMKDLIAFSDMNPIIIREILENLHESYY